MQVYSVPRFKTHYVPRQAPVKAVGSIWGSFTSGLSNIGDWFQTSQLGQALGTVLTTAAGTAATIGISSLLRDDDDGPATQTAQQPYYNPLLQPQTAQQPVYVQQPQTIIREEMPDWVLPAAIGGGVLILVLALKK